MAGNCLRTATNEIVTTEWEDIQYKHGNKVGAYATQEEEILRQKTMKDMIEEAIDNYDPLENRTVEQLDEMLQEDGRGDDDEDALVAYRRKRREEMLEKQRGKRFGNIRHITKSQYVDEVSKAGDDLWVLCMLIEEGDDSCNWLLRIMGEVADRQPQIKIVSIKSTDAIANFPKQLLPTVLVYQSGVMQRQLNGLQAFGAGNGSNPTVEDTEALLRKLGPLRGALREDDSEGEQDEDEEEREARTAGTMRSAGGRSKFSLMR
eukprot:TRINITY_DN5434_c0_g1_i1.p1 TRINITY_DN5434_c0_g1~~TRINITY_DN5434_c0_g1_i1.p1  ORF type:complete len:262 (+),score=117.60 TRINITY_DN5434_c0_g1_i1:107-892(+)